MKEIKLNGVAFNLQAVANYSSAEDFYNSPSHQHYWGNVTESERHKRLTFVYEQAKGVSVHDYMPVTEINILDVDKENNTMTVEIVQATQGDKILSVTPFSEVKQALSNDSSTTDNKHKKSKRPRRNSKDVD